MADIIKKGLEVGENNYIFNIIPEGGTSGQVLAKNSDTNYDLKWSDGPVETPGEKIIDIGELTITLKSEDPDCGVTLLEGQFSTEQLAVISTKPAAIKCKFLSTYSQLNNLLAAFYLFSRDDDVFYVSYSFADNPNCLEIARINFETGSFTVGLVEEDTFIIDKVKTKTWSTTPTDAKVPSEKLVKDSLDLKANSSDLSTVATSGDYDDLNDIPIINQDLNAASFTPILGRYYRHIAGSLPTPTSLNTTDDYQGFYFNFNATLNESDFTDEEQCFIASKGASSVTLAQYEESSHSLYGLSGKLYDFTTNKWSSTLLVNDKGYLDLSLLGIESLKFVSAKNNWNGNIISATTFISIYDENGIYKCTNSDVVEYLDISNSISKKNPSATGSLSLNRREGSKIGLFSTALGASCIASGSESLAEGSDSQATGRGAHAEGECSVAAGVFSHVEGVCRKAYGEASHAEGQGGESFAAKEVSSIQDKVLTMESIDHGIQKNSILRHTEDGEYNYYKVSAVDGVKVTLDTDPKVSDIYNWGLASVIAFGKYSHCEGEDTTTIGVASHAEGCSTRASGTYSHAEGYSTKASGDYGSHAEGANTTASGLCSHAEGIYTTANHICQHVFGQWNIEDPSTEPATARGTYVEIVGKGSYENPSNARTLDWQGNEWLAGNLQAAGLTDGTTTKTMTEILSGSSSVLDTNVTLSADLKTYYPIGKITDASPKNPITVGTAGQTLRDVFNNIMNLTELQPTKIDPSINGISFTGSSTASEIGSELNSLTYSISKSDGEYTYDDTTGVTWSNFTFNGASTTSSSSTSGTLQLTSPYKVGVTGTINIGVTGTHSAGNIAKTNAGNQSNPVVQIQAGTKTYATTFTKPSYTPSFIILSGSTPTSLSMYSIKAAQLNGSFEIIGKSSDNNMYIIIPTSRTLVKLTSGGFDVPYSLISESTNFTLNGVTVAMKIYEMTDPLTETMTFNVQCN